MNAWVYISAGRPTLNHFQRDRNHKATEQSLPLVGMANFERLNIRA